MVDVYIESKKIFCHKLLDENEKALQEGRIDEGTYVNSVNSVKKLYEFYQSPLAREIYLKHVAKLQEYESLKNGR
jgi:hypothetical protein